MVCDGISYWDSTFPRVFLIIPFRVLFVRNGSDMQRQPNQPLNMCHYASKWITFGGPVDLFDPPRLFLEPRDD